MNRPLRTNRTPVPRRLGAVLVVTLLLAACSSDDGGPGATGARSTTGPTSTPAPSSTTAAETGPSGLTVQPGTEQLAVLGAEPGTVITAALGDEVSTGTADAQGSLLFRGLTPGEYRVSGPDGLVDVVTVASRDAVPPPSLYDGQTLPTSGFGYLTTRDGTTLSINVLLPGPAENGPYPTVVEYSGYQPSDPGDTTLAQLYTVFGFAYVGVNMRGTGCSGGSYGFFEESQLLDGYDVIETVAAQPWVTNHSVGMVGVSYPGITQLFVASTRPPHLAAIAPLSVSDDLYRSTLYPGGLLNTGFTVDWVAQRMAEAKPAGQEWAAKRIAEGDTQCADNQRLRLQNPDLVAQLRAEPFYDPAVADPLNPSELVGAIDVPVFIAGSWQDEQTGGHWPELIDDFTSAPHVYATLVNGLHTESLSLGVLRRYIEFLDLYIGHRVPTTSLFEAAAPSIIYQFLTGAIVTAPPDDRFAGMTYDQALTAFEAEPPVRVLYEEGAADGQVPGSPVPRFRADFAAWPIPDTEAVPVVLTPGAGGTTYTYDPDAAPDTFYAGDLSDIWRADVSWDWKPVPAGAAVAFEGPTLAEDLVLTGTGSADLWITSTVADTDLEVTLTEIRPDGQEVYIQSGWLRASQRALDEDASTQLQPVQTHLEEDAAPLEPGVPTLVRVEIFPFAHALRAGSRLRIVVGSPGGNRAQWAFEDLPAGGQIEVLTDAAHPSTVWLPKVSGVVVPAGLPACGALRGQPCRAYVPLG